MNKFLYFFKNEQNESLTSLKIRGVRVNEYWYEGIRLACILILLIFVDFFVWYKFKEIIKELNIELTPTKQKRLKYLISSIVSVMLFSPYFLSLIFRF